VGSGEQRLKRLIVTADDFGAATAVNDAVEMAFRDGTLTAASLMVAAPASGDAVRRAKALPGLAVGLHLVVVRGGSTLPASEVPAITDGDGRFDDNLVRAGFRYYFSSRARRQLRAEIRAQFQAFADTGLALDHVNTHNHMHLHPTILGLILEIGRDFGMTAMRLPYETTSGMAGRLLKPWLTLTKSRLDRAGIRHNDILIGLSATGRMNRDRMIEALSDLPDGVSEMMTHPATGDWEGREREADGYRYTDELAGLLDPAVRAAAERSGARRITFTEIV